MKRNFSMLRGILCSTTLSNRTICRKYVTKKTLHEKYRALFYPKLPKAPYNFVCQIGDPVLRQKCDKVDESLIGTKKFQSLIERMWEVHGDYNLVGLSAPQVGLPLQICVVGFTQEQCGKASLQPCAPILHRVLINPVIKILDYKSKVTSPEGCASMCGFIAHVSRYTDISVEALNEKGEKLSWNSKGFEARVIQHEIDHLGGTTFVDVMEPKTLECTVWQRVNAHKGKGYISFQPVKKSFFGLL